MSVPSGRNPESARRLVATAIEVVRLSMSMAPRPHTSPSISSPPKGSCSHPSGRTGPPAARTLRLGAAVEPPPVVVDGSNIATEGRSLPSLSQLDEAVRAFQEEYPGREVIVVVDASFEHRVEESERKTFRDAEAAGEIVSPPAGAIGRGDRFLLQIADRTGATVRSNDASQDFHGDA